MKLSPVILGSLFLISALAGWVLKPDAPQQKAPPKTVATPASKNPLSPKTTSAIPSELARAIESVTFDLTLSDLVAQHRPGRLTELALWLTDASSDEMAEAWHALDAADKMDTKARDLFLREWTKVDPRGAIAAARETGQERVAWWAWGRTDPEKAFAACQAEAPQYIAGTLRGIGQEHPDLARRLLEENPKLSIRTAIEGIAEGMDDEDPQAAFEFAAKHGQGDRIQLQNLALADPTSALEWIKTHRLSSYDMGDAMTVLVNEHPEEVAQYLSELPTGKLRSELLKAQVIQLADQDPSLAFELRGRTTGIQPPTQPLPSTRPNKQDDPNDASRNFGKAFLTTSARTPPFFTKTRDYMIQVVQQMLASSPDETVALLQEHDQLNLDSRYR